MEQKVLIKKNFIQYSLLLAIIANFFNKIKFVMTYLPITIVHDHILIMIGFLIFITLPSSILLLGISNLSSSMI